jgi:serine/threonine-protein phosphatase PGAM5
VSARRRVFICAIALWSFVSAAAIHAAENDKGVHTLFLVRHGIYDAVRGADSKTANALNPLGREQAELIAARLAALPIKFTTIVSSEFTRARETGDIIAAKLGAKCERDGLLNEGTPPGIDIAPPKATPDPGAAAQFNEAWTRYSRPTPDAARNDILVCHGNVIRWLVCKALGVDSAQWTRMGAANCALTVIRIEPDGVARVLVYNDVSHLPLEKQTWEQKHQPFLPAAK